MAKRKGGRIIDVFALLEGFANLNEKSVREGRDGNYYLELEASQISLGSLSSGIANRTSEEMVKSPKMKAPLEPYSSRLCSLKPLVNHSVLGKKLYQAGNCETDRQKFLAILM